MIKHKTQMKRFCAAFTALLMTAGIFAGCGSTNGNGEETAVSESIINETSFSESTLVSETQAPAETEAAPALLDCDGLITSVTADSMVGQLIKKDTAFTVTSSRDVSADELKSVLSFSTGTPFSLEKKASCSYSLKTLESFPENSMAVLSLNNGDGQSSYKWAFQTDGSFIAESSYPEDGTEYADTDTGIEIRLSSRVSEENAEDYFEISPKVEGTFSSYRNTLYFVPDKELEADSYYNVRLKKGFPSADGSPLREDFSFTFKTTQNGGSKYFYDSGHTETFIEGDLAVIEIFASEELKSPDVEYSLKLYSYKGAEDYYNALKELVDSGINESSYEFSTDGLTEIHSSVSTLIEGKSSWGPAFLLLPDNLENGYYLAEVSTVADGVEYSLQRHIQVDPVSVYAAELNGCSQLFINDTQTGKPAEGASAELYTADGTYSASADKDGLALLSHNSTAGGTGLLKVTYNGYTFIDLYNYGKKAEPSSKDLYYSYIYTDREAYMSTDKMKIWGIVRPRSSDVPMPEDLYIRAYDRYSEEVIMGDFPVTLNENGTFTSEISFERSREYWWIDLGLFSGENEICSKIINIKDYEKPSYVYDISLPVVWDSPQSDPVPASIQASFYDGTPADGLSFDVYGGKIKHNEPESIVTDKNGFASVEVQFSDIGGDSYYSPEWYPKREYVNFTLKGVQNDYAYGGKAFWGIYRDVMLEYEYDRMNKRIDFELSKISTGNITEADLEYYRLPNDKIRGEAADAEITAVLNRRWYTRTEKGSYYDALQKKTIKTYDYNENTEQIKTYTLTTKNGKAFIEDLPLDDKDSSYYLEITYNDSRSRATRQRIYLWGTEYGYYNDSSRRSYTFSPDKTEFKENEVIRFTLMNNGWETDIEEGGRILFQVHGNDLITSEIYDTAIFEHTMTAKYIPTVNVMGAYFDGRHVYPVKEGWDYFSFDPSDRMITVDIKADKEKYSPGDTAKVTITANAPDGKPLEAAAVSLSVVDEAAFAVANQNADPLESIYDDFYLPAPDQYYSYIQHTLDPESGAESGGGGDEFYIRKEFLDTAAFFNVCTDSSGKAELEFKLPDNITSWRLTAQAVWEKQTDVVYAGASRSPLIVTQPVFISPVVQDTYVVGDDISVSARCYGETNADEIITVTLSGNGTEKTLTAPSGRSANFGKLPAGEYKILFTAENENGKDAVELPITVTDSLLEMDIVKGFDLSEGIDIKPSRYPVNITFYDKEYMLYTDTLFKLFEQVTERLDTRIANAFALKEFGAITEEEFAEEFEGIMSQGTAKLLPASEDDPELTALICLAAPELADKQAVVRHMYSVLENRNSTANEVASAYLALAAMGEPVMTEIRDVLENSDYSYETGNDDMYEEAVLTEMYVLREHLLMLCAALAAAGDYDGAEVYYEKFAAKTAVTDGDKMYIDGDYPKLLTKYALLTASMLHKPEADMMTRYLLNNEQYYDSFVLELMVYLENYTAKSENGAEFTYDLNGKTETVKPASHFGTRLSFSEAQLAAADFKVTSGEVFAVASYKGSTDENSDASSLKVTKNISAVGGGTLRIGCDARVDIEVEGGGYYVITDVIPSCGRNTDTSGFKSQRITLYTDKNGEASYTFTIAAEGEYVVESAAARSNRDDKWGISERSVIKVKGYDESA